MVEVPIIRFKGFNKEFLSEFAAQLIDDVSSIVHVPKEIVKIEMLNIEPISDTPMTVEIYIFPRAQEVHDTLASVLNTRLKTFGFENVHIFFILLSPHLYYKEGKPLNSKL